MRKPFEHDPDAVTEAREAAGLTKTQVAEALGCSLSLISEIESGTRNARLPLLTRMAELFDRPIDDLRRKDGEAA